MSSASGSEPGTSNQMHQRPHSPSPLLTPLRPELVSAAPGLEPQPTTAQAAADITHATPWHSQPHDVSTANMLDIMSLANASLVRPSPLPAAAPAGDPQAGLAVIAQLLAGLDASAASPLNTLLCTHLLTLQQQPGQAAAVRSTRKVCRPADATCGPGASVASRRVTSSVSADR